ncbi:hypothetical protein, partial [Lentzea roselyniae]|uniref:hypothetical protein n=1 Tax=Lentzea roselyniae TaxID=531940 RepID=UPI0031F9DF09
MPSSGAEQDRGPDGGGHEDQVAQYKYHCDGHTAVMQIVPQQWELQVCQSTADDDQQGHRPLPAPRVRE